MGVTDVKMNRRIIADANGFFNRIIPPNYILYSV